MGEEVERGRGGSCDGVVESEGVRASDECVFTVQVTPPSLRQTVSLPL